MLNEEIQRLRKKKIIPNPPTLHIYAIQDFNIFRICSSVYWNKFNIYFFQFIVKEHCSLHLTSISPFILPSFTLNNTGLLQKRFPRSRKLWEKMQQLLETAVLLHCLYYVLDFFVLDINNKALFLSNNWKLCSLSLPLNLFYVIGASQIKCEYLWSFY